MCTITISSYNLSILQCPNSRTELWKIYIGKVYIYMLAFFVHLIICNTYSNIYMNVFAACCLVLVIQGFIGKSTNLLDFSTDYKNLVFH